MTVDSVKLHAQFMTLVGNIHCCRTGEDYQRVVIRDVAQLVYRSTGKCLLGVH